VVAGLVYLVTLFLFIPVPFVEHFVLTPASSAFPLTTVRPAPTSLSPCPTTLRSHACLYVFVCRPYSRRLCVYLSLRSWRCCWRRCCLSAA
jgi:hypothetical protein